MTTFLQKRDKWIVSDTHPLIMTYQNLMLLFTVVTDGIRFNDLIPLEVGDNDSFQNASLITLASKMYGLLIWRYYAPPGVSELVENYMFRGSFVMNICVVLCYQ